MQTVTTGLFTVCLYKLPYVVLDIQSYSVVVAIGGLILGVLSLVSGLALTWLAGYFSYPQIMLGGCITSGCLTLTASILMRKQIPLIQQDFLPEKSAEKVPLVKMISQPIFYRLLPGNMIRGFSMGVLSVLTVVALDLGFGEQIATAMVPVQSMATILMCCFFGSVAKRENVARLIMMGSLGFLLLPMLLISKVGWQFLLGYFTVCIGKGLVDYSIPIALRWVVPIEIAGMYQAWCMALTYCGMVLGTLTAALLSSRAVMLVSAISMIVAGVIYYVSLKSVAPLFEG